FCKYHLPSCSYSENGALILSEILLLDVEGHTKITSTSRSYFKNEALALLSIILSEIVRNIPVQEDCTSSRSCSENGALVLSRVVLFKIVKNNLILREDRRRIASHREDPSKSAALYRRS
ncbi:hypothetical protein K0M31_006942, partial [Melipona bicolor]